VVGLGFYGVGRGGRVEVFLELGGGCDDVRVGDGMGVGGWLCFILWLQLIDTLCFLLLEISIWNK